MALSKIQLSEAVGRRNLVHNGSMIVAQRGTVTNGTGLSGTGCDRFRLAMSGGAAATTRQHIAALLPHGFRNSLEVDVTTADTSVAAGDYVILYQRIEGQDLQHLLYGTSRAKKVTVQFWVKSPKTGIHICELYHLDAGYTNSIQYTVSSANTWENKIVTFDGYQTTSFDDDRDGSLQIAWWLLAGSTYSDGTHNSNTWHNGGGSTLGNRAVGQVNVFDDVANNFYLTGVQVEVSDSATDFEHRSFAEELQLCQRYYYKISSVGSSDERKTGFSRTGDTCWVDYYFPVEMNHAPVLETSGNANHYSVQKESSTITCDVVPYNNSSGKEAMMVSWHVASGLTAGEANSVRFTNSNTFLAFESDI